MGPRETCNSGPKVSVLHAKTTDEGLGPIETCHSDANHAVLHAKTTGKVWDQERLVILAVLHPKTTHEGWDP